MAMALDKAQAVPSNAKRQMDMYETIRTATTAMEQLIPTPSGTKIPMATAMEITK